MKFQRIQDLRIDSDLSQKKIGEISLIIYILVSELILIMKQDLVIFQLKC